MGARVAIFGAGVAGLSTARALAARGHEVHVYEAAERAGGLAASYRDPDGFAYDHGPHFLLSSLADLLGIGAECAPVRYYEDLHVGGRSYAFPFGFVRNPAYCASVAWATLTRPLRRPPGSLADFLTAYYGAHFAGQVLIPLIEKWAGAPAATLSLDFAHRLLPADLGYVVYSLLKRLRGGVTEDYYQKGRTVVYPREGCASIIRALATTPGVQVHLGAPLERLEVAGGRVTGSVVGGKAVAADHYVSTIPLDDLARLLAAPPEVQPWLRLRYRGVRLLFVKLARPRLLEHLWTWFPEPRYPFYRIAEYKNARADLAPPGKTLVSVESSYDPGAASVTASAAFDAVRPHLEALYGLRPQDVIELRLRESPAAYPVMLTSTEAIQRGLTHRTPYANLFITGRTGQFQYRMLEATFKSGLSCAAAVQARIDGVSGPAVAAVPRDRWGRPLVAPE